MDPATMFTIASVAAKGIAGIKQIITGDSQEAKADEMARNNIRPVYHTQQQVIDDDRIAASRASEGMSDASRMAYTNAAERGLTSGADAILKGGGSVNNIADLYGAYENGVSRMSTIDEEMRSRNMKDFYATDERVADAADKEFQVNQWGPYADTAQAAAALRKQASDNKWKGVNTGISAVSDAAASFLYAKEGANVYGAHTPPPVGSPLIQPAPSPQQVIQNRYPGLMNGSWGVTPFASDPNFNPQ